MARYRVTAKRKKKTVTIAETEDAVLDIGSRSSCLLTLDDPIAAERHAEFQYADGRFYIQDTGSATGTFLNGLKVRELTLVTPGDVIVIGASRLVTSIVEGEAEPTLELDLQAFRTTESANDE